jgi:hypothetical protein
MEDGFGYYLVSFEWMKAWRNYIGKQKIEPPGKISNEALKHKIQKEK